MRSICGSIGVVGEVVELPLVQPVAAHRDLDDRDVGDVELDDERLLDAGRQRVQDLRHALRHLELRVVQVDAVVEPDADRREPLPRQALDAIDAGRRADGALDRLGDRLLDVGGARACVEGRDADDGDVDLREQVDAEPPQRRRTPSTTVISDIIRMKTGLRSASRVSHMAAGPQGALAPSRRAASRPRRRRHERVRAARGAHLHAVGQPLRARDDHLVARGAGPP